MVTGSKPTSTRADVEAVLKPDPRRFAPRILSWILCWPWDMLCSLIANNPLQLMVIFVAKEVRAGLDEITQGEFKDIEQDLIFDEPSVKPAPEPIMPAVVNERMTPPVAIEPIVAKTPVAQPAPTVAATAPVLQPAMSSAALLAAYPDDPWYASRLPAGHDDVAPRETPVWTPPQIRMLGQASVN